MSSSNSSQRPLIEDSIAHAAQNVLEIGNQSNFIVTSDGIRVADQLEIVTYIKTVLAASILTVDYGTEFDYRPESLSAKLYGTPDLAYVLMLLNDVGSRLDFVGPKIKVVDPYAARSSLETILKRNAKKVAKTSDTVAEGEVLKEIF